MKRADKKYDLFAAVTGGKPLSDSDRNNQNPQFNRAG
jgi:hypothetical protein